MDPAARLAEAVRLKQLGNADFKRGVMFLKHTAGKNSLADSCKHYAEALQFTEGLAEAIAAKAPADDAEAEAEGGEAGKVDGAALQDQLQAVRLALFLNLCIAGLKLDSFDSALRCADQAILLDATNPKAHFRRGQALFGLKDYDQAEAALRAALKLTPRDAAVKKEIRLVRETAKKEREATQFREATEKGMARLLEQQGGAIEAAAAPGQSATRTSNDAESKGDGTKADAVAAEEKDTPVAVPPSSSSAAAAAVAAAGGNEVARRGDSSGGKGLADDASVAPHFEATMDMVTAGSAVAAAPAAPAVAPKTAERSRADKLAQAPPELLPNGGQ